MSEELFLWWDDLSNEERYHYAGTTTLTPSATVVAAYERYQDLDSRVYRPFNPDTMVWHEYAKTSDYIVHHHHQMKKYFLKKGANDAKRRHLVNHGIALADSMSVDEYIECTGCQIMAGSQRDHLCLGYE